MQNKLVILYQRMSQLTAPICAKECRCPHTCCAPEHCNLTAEIALERYGVELPTTDHPRLPFMGANGCTVPPHLRPICTVHVCSINGLAVIRTPDGNGVDFNRTEEYFQLRNEIDLEEFERYGTT